MAKKRIVRVDFQKKRNEKPREGDLTRRYLADDDAADTANKTERVRAKGDISRKRTIRVEDESDTLALDGRNSVRGRVLSVQGLYCVIVTEDGQSHRCYLRRLLKTLAIDQRSAVTVGDWVWFRPAPGNEGLILRVEERGRTLRRNYRNEQQVIAANIEQVLIVGSLAEPFLKPHLIDRYLVGVEQNDLRALICLNKADLVDCSQIQHIVGMYSQLGYMVVIASANGGMGVDQLRHELRGKESVIVGQSGVGKSSLLNALEPKFHLKVREVSTANQKGRHTTTTAQLFRLPDGGTVIDTPGVRQFELDHFESPDLTGLFVEFRAPATRCRFPGCTHTHELGCAIKRAVRLDLIHRLRYESYLRILSGEPAGR